MSTSSSLPELTRFEQGLKSILSEAEVNRIGLETGQSKRLRIVTPFRLFCALVTALGSAKIESIADPLCENSIQILVRRRPTKRSTTALLRRRFQSSCGLSLRD